MIRIERMFGPVPSIRPDWPKCMPFPMLDGSGVTRMIPPDVVQVLQRLAKQQKVVERLLDGKPEVIRGAE